MKMKITILAVTLFLCSALTAQVTVYRGVQRRNAQRARINNNQWRVDPDGVSTYEGPNFNQPDRPCMVSFVILNTGQVQGMPTGYVGEYTPLHGVGHWSIHGPAGSGRDDLKREITQYVINRGRIDRKVTAVNTEYTGRHPSKCLTPSTLN